MLKIRFLFVIILLQVQTKLISCWIWSKFKENIHHNHCTGKSWSLAVRHFSLIRNTFRNGRVFWLRDCLLSWTRDCTPVEYFNVVFKFKLKRFFFALDYKVFYSKGFKFQTSQPYKLKFLLRQFSKKYKYVGFWVS